MPRLLDIASISRALIGVRHGRRVDHEVLAPCRRLTAQDTTAADDAHRAAPCVVRYRHRAGVLGQLQICPRPSLASPRPLTGQSVAPIRAKTVPRRRAGTVVRSGWAARPHGPSARDPEHAHVQHTSQGLQTIQAKAHRSDGDRHVDPRRSARAGVNVSVRAWQDHTAWSASSARSSRARRRRGACTRTTSRWPFSTSPEPGDAGPHSGRATVTRRRPLVALRR